jgi:hypothetical protein
MPVRLSQWWLCSSPGCNLPMGTLMKIKDMDTKEKINFHRCAGDEEKYRGVWKKQMVEME